jgi:hypothetical protein
VIAVSFCKQKVSFIDPIVPVLVALIFAHSLIQLFAQIFHHTAFSRFKQVLPVTSPAVVKMGLEMLDSIDFTRIFFVIL